MKQWHAVRRHPPGKWWAHLDSNQRPTGYEPLLAGGVVLVRKGRRTLAVFTVLDIENTKIFW